MNPLPPRLDAAALAGTPPPWVLDQPGTTYTLDCDVIAPGTALVLAAPGITLDLSGHVITFDAEPAACTEGFEASGKGWDLSGGAAVVRNDTGLFGAKVLRLPVRAGANRVVVSPPIPVAAGHWAAGCAVSAPGGTQSQPAQVTLDVLGPDGTVLGSATGGGWNADGPVARFTAPGGPIRLRFTVAPAGDAAVTVDLDHLAVTAEARYGVLAAAEWHVPGWEALPESYRQVAGPVAIRNGSLVQGAGRSRSSAAVLARSLPGDLTLTGLTLIVTGDDSAGVDASEGSGARTVTGCTVTCSGDCDISRRASDLAALRLERAPGPVTVAGCTLTDFPQVGILLTGCGGEVRDNILHPRSVVTNAYGIVLVGCTDLTVRGNTITTLSGRGAYGGISLDGYAATPLERVTVEGNTVDISGCLTREYGDAVAVRALRVRNNVDAMGPHRDLHVVGNTFAARTSKGGPKSAYGARLSYANPRVDMDDAGILFERNTYRANVATTDPDYEAVAFDLDGLAAGIRPVFRAERYESNDLALWIGGADGDDLGAHDATFDGCTFARAPGVSRAWAAVRAGYWQGPIANVTFTGAGPPPAVVPYRPGLRCTTTLSLQLEPEA